MKKKGVKDFILVFLIIFQLACPSYLAADNNSALLDMPSSPTSLDHHSPTKDLGLLTRQYRVDFIYENGERKEASRVSLLDLNLNLQKPSIFNPAKDLRFEYNEDTKELWIIFSEINRATKQKHDVMAHVFTDVELTSLDIVADSDLLIFATTEGIRATLVDRIMNCGFVEPVLVPIISPPISENDPKVSSLKFINVQENLSNYIKDLNKGIHEGDLLVGTESTTQLGSTDYTVLDRSTIILTLRTQILGTLYLSSFYLDRANQEDLVKQIESILDSDQDVISEFVKSHEKIIKNISSNDLLTHALKNIASGDKLKSSLFLLQKDSSNQDLITRYAKLTRLRFTAQDSANIDQLINAFESQTGTKITNTKKREIIISYFKAKTQKLLATGGNTSVSNNNTTTWSQSLLEEILANEDFFKESAVKEKNVFKKILSSTSKLWSKLSKKFKYSLATTSVVAATISSYLYVVPSASAQAVELVSNIASGLWDILNYSTKVPILSIITEPIAGLFNYINEQGFVAGARTLMGLGIVLSFYPLSLMLAKLFNLSSTKNESLLQTFFNFGIRIYAKLCYPLVKFAWDAFNQKNVYPAVKIDMPPIFNGIFDSKEKIQQKLDDSLAKYSHAQDISFITKVLAACIVADLSDVDTRALLLAESGVQIQTVADLLSKGSSSNIAAIENIIYTTLMDVGDNKDLANMIDEDELDKYIQVFTDVKNKIKNNPTVKPGFFSRLYSGFKKVLSKKIVPYLLLGKQGLDFYYKYKNATIDKTTSDIAGATFRNDYIVSAAIYAGMDPAKFGVGDIGNAEIFANQFGQIVLFGIQGPIDPLTVSEFSLEGSYPLQENVYKQKQSIGNYIKASFSTSPTLSSVGFLDNHAQYIANLATGFNVRFLADYIIRVPGVIITTMVATGTLMSLAEILDCTIKCVFLSTFFLLAKISISTAFIGYVVIWPYVQLAMKRSKISISSNNTLLNEAGNLINEGIRFQDIEKARKGVFTLKTIYMFAKQEIPPEFDKPINEFSFNDVEAFNKYTQDNVPIPTIYSKGTETFINVAIGSWISTLLFTGVSGMVYRPDLSTMDAIGLLGYAILFLGITYGSLKTVSWVIKHIFNKKVETVLDESLLEKIDNNENVSFSREDVIKIIERIKSPSCTDLFTEPLQK